MSTPVTVEFSSVFQCSSQAGPFQSPGLMPGMAHLPEIVLPLARARNSFPAKKVRFDFSEVLYLTDVISSPVKVF